MPDPINIGRESRRRRALDEVSRSLESVERLLAAAKRPTDRIALESELERLRRRREALSGELVPESVFTGRREEWWRLVRGPNFGGEVDARWPILLLPLKLETRFFSGDGPRRPAELRIRFFPDHVAIRTHESSLTIEEREEGATFWGRIAEAAGEDDQRSAWAALLSLFGAGRAAWIAHRTHPDLAPAETPATKTDAWSRAPSVEVLPEYLHVRGYAGNRTVFSEITLNPIDPTVLVGPDPETEEAHPARPAPLTPAEFFNGMPKEIRWLVDFTEAEARGLAIRIALSEADAARGLDRLVVLGVRVAADQQEGAALLGELFEGHRYGEGLSLVPQGTPTNNTETDSAGFGSRTDPSESYALEFGPSRWEVGDAEGVPGSSRDGQVLARALGLDPILFERMPFADESEQLDAFHMARALWPTTGGYYLRQILADTVPEEVVRQIRAHYLEYVRARGPLPAVRIDRTPYGLLPVTSTRALRDAEGEVGIEQWLPDLLWRLRQEWLRISQRAPRLPGTTDPERSLFDVMSMLPTSARFYASAVFGDEFISHLVSFLLGGSDPGRTGSSLLEPAEKDVDAALDELGFSGKKPRLRSFTFKRPAPVEEAYLVAPVADAAPFPNALAENYLLWLARAVPEDFDAETGLPQVAGGALLYRLLRTARRNAVIEAASHILHEMIDPRRRQFRFEPEIVGVPGLVGEAASQLLSTPLPGVARGSRLGGLTVGGYLFGAARGDPMLRQPVKIGDRELRPETPLVNELAEMNQSLEFLAKKPKDKLQLLMCETLDGCSHRLDAWITSLATRRLFALRTSEGATGIYLGAFGWLENVRQKQTARNDGGFLLAPSQDQASAAAVLRNGFLAHRESAQAGQLAVKLSSERVKTANDFFDRFRAGMPIGAVLGYHFQRGLHDRGVPAGLEQYLPALQDAFPLDAGELTPHTGATEEVGARNVVNGRDLVDQWRTFRTSAPAGQPGSPLFGRADLPAVGTAHYHALAAELDRLDEAHDAMKDVALAEAVYQSVRGDYERARAVSDGMAGARHMPEIDFTRSRRGGTRLKHRVIAPLPMDPNLVADGWPAFLTARAEAALALNRWLRYWIGDPRRIGIYIRYGVPPELHEEVATLADLEGDALDALEFTSSVGPGQLGELELRVQRWLLSRGSTWKRIEISFTDPPAWGRGDRTPPRPERMFGEVAPLLDFLRRALSHARAVVAEDLVHPDQAGEAPLEGIDFAELTSRAEKAVKRLWDAHNALAGELAPFLAEGAARPNPAQLRAIHDACADLSRFGFPSALTPAVVPLQVPPSEQQNVAILLRREVALQSEVVARLRDLLGVPQHSMPTEPAVVALNADLRMRLEALDRPATPAAETIPLDQLTSRQRLQETIQKEELRRALLKRCEELLRGVFGRAFPITLEFNLPADHPLQPSFDGLLHRGSPLTNDAELDANDDALKTWIYRMGEIHPAVGDFGKAALIAEVQTGALLELRTAQHPYTSGEKTWVGIVEDSARIAPDSLSVLFTDPPNFGGSFSGLMLGSWEETIANKAATAGLAFHFDQSGSEPPHVMLLAVAPPQAGREPRWNAETLFEILTETMDLARIRLVDGDLLEKFGPLTPTVFLPHVSSTERLSLHG